MSCQLCCGVCCCVETFWTNPQYRVTVTDPDEDDNENMGTVIVALMQKDRRKKRSEGLDMLTVGYCLYKVCAHTFENLGLKVLVKCKSSVSVI